MSFTDKIASVNVQILKLRMANCKNNSDFQKKNCNTQGTWHLTRKSAYVSSDSDVVQSTFERGEPHLQDDIRRKELDGECRDATEEEAEERPYPEDTSDWPALHQITDTFRQNMTETGSLKCPDGSYPRSKASNRQFSKAYCYRFLSNGGEN